MVLWFVIVLSIVGVSLALVMYANLLPFIGTLWDIKEYNMAYYGAQSALERSLLVLRQRESWFEGEWWWTWNTFVWPVSDRLKDFGWFEREGNNLYRHIEGRDSQVPSPGQGMVEPYLLSGAVSNNYNILWYIHPQTIGLWYDATDVRDAYSMDDSIIRSFSWAGHGLSAYLTLNDTIKNAFASQWSNASNLSVDDDYDGDGTSDDIAVDRWRKGHYYNVDNLQSWTFTILPRSVITYNSGGIGTVSANDDESIRESVINTVLTGAVLRISSSTNEWEFNPLSTVYTPNASSHRIITDYDQLSGTSFIDLLAGGSPDLPITQQSLTLSLFSPLLTSLSNLYPFVQYKVVCEGCDSSSSWSLLAQPYFIINGKSTVGDYSVTMQLRRSIDEAWVVSQFTVIF